MAFRFASLMLDWKGGSVKYGIYRIHRIYRRLKILLKRESKACDIALLRNSDFNAERIRKIEHSL
jgi:hypothetical protein